MRRSGKEAEEKSLPHHWLKSFYGGPNRSRETQLHLSLSPRLLGEKCRARMDGFDCLKPFPHSLYSRRAKGLNGLKIRCHMKK